MNLTIIRGLPGSGKTTLALDESERTGAIVIESDQLRVRDGAYVFIPKEANALNATTGLILNLVAKHGADAIVTGAFCKAFTINRIVHEVKRTCKGTVSVRIIRCADNFGNRHNIPEHILQEMALAFEDIDGETFHYADEQ